MGLIKQRLARKNSHEILKRHMQLSRQVTAEAQRTLQQRTVTPVQTDVDEYFITSSVGNIRAKRQREMLCNRPTPNTGCFDCM
jgi:hypothetical protein